MTVASGNSEVSNWVSYLIALIRGCVGAIIGGVVGYALFQWILRQGFRAEAIPGALVGAGFGLLSGKRSWILGLVAGILGSMWGIVVEWRFFPFADDESFAYFIANLHQKPQIVLIALGVGSLVAFWLGLGADFSKRRTGV